MSLNIESALSAGNTEPDNRSATDKSLQTQTNASAIRSVIAGILHGVEENVNYNRDRFTREGVSAMAYRYGEFNWIMCHTDHSYVWSGTKGVDWEHWHHELDINGPGTIG
ncbi:hypothetical protein B0H34DRAFT_726811 [Crassisporium funariophilum]|nr:hypothetical protein B0H34DRAFT_726811 [Crassisporium funariophilum]